MKSNEIWAKVALLPKIGNISLRAMSLFGCYGAKVAIFR
jgi:hypothetical protein